MGSFESYTTDITLKNIAGLELEIVEVMDIINCLKNKENFQSLKISLPKLIGSCANHRDLISIIQS
jgi:ATP-dependent Zn protease